VSNLSNLSNLLTQPSRAGIKRESQNSDLLQHLRFRLYPDLQAMLPISQITEVLKLQLTQITPIPQMPAWVMGVYNWRGEILWTIDLGRFLGFDSWYQHQHDRALQTAIVLTPYREQSDSGIHIGLVVAAVEDIEFCDLAAIQAEVDSQTNSRLSSFLQGYWLPPGREIILALDGLAVAKAMPTSNY